jgi:hypothetical protein
MLRLIVIPQLVFSASVAAHPRIKKAIYDDVPPTSLRNPGAGFHTAAKETAGHLVGGVEGGYRHAAQNASRQPFKYRAQNRPWRTGGVWVGR